MLMYDVNKDCILNKLNSTKVSLGYLDSHRKLIGWNGVKGGYARYFVECDICKEDPEIFDSGIFKMGMKELLKGSVCGCSKRKPPICIKRLVERQCRLEGYKILSPIADDFKASDKLHLGCPEGHEYSSTSISKFYSCGRRCPHCANNVAWNLDKFLVKAKEVHKDRWDYSKVTKVSNSKEKLTIICPLHGEWQTDVHHHINRGQGCPHIECVGSKINKSKRQTCEEFIGKSVRIHGNKYNYSQVDYYNIFTPVDIYCNSCCKFFKQNPSEHTSGCGCPYCAGRNQKQVYIFKVYDNNNLIAVKSGIANYYRSRFLKQNRVSVYDVVVYKVYEFSDTECCKKAERYCIDNYDSSFLSKEEYPDGYRETYPVSDLSNIQETIKVFGGEAVEL